jgi:hypothetical protein
VKDVYVAGARVVRDGEVPHIDIDAALARLQAAQDAALGTTAARDWARRDVDAMSPRVYRMRG